jgi:hypothetical protein
MRDIARRQFDRQILLSVLVVVSPSGYTAVNFRSTCFLELFSECFKRVALKFQNTGKIGRPRLCLVGFP